MAKKKKKRLIPMKELLMAENNISLYRKYIPEFDDQTPSEQERCMAVNHLRVVQLCLPPVALPDWEV